MTLNNKKMIIISSILAVSVILLLVFMLLGVNFGAFRIPSVSYILGEYNLAKKSEKELTSTQDIYYSTVNNLEKSQTEYNRQKNKYNSISDETIDVIKEATTEETYNLEYMWIKLGNYAKKNNLEIVMVEPGGQMGSSSGGNNSSTTANNTSNTTTTTNNTNNTNNTNTTTTTTAGNQTSNTTSSDSSALRIQVTGSYMNTSDFIFEVENDTALRFKLDNISMDYVEGNTIKTSFNVKNIVINK